MIDREEDIKAVEDLEWADKQQQEENHGKGILYDYYGYKIYEGQWKDDEKHGNVVDEHLLNNVGGLGR